MDFDRAAKCVGSIALAVLSLGRLALDVFAESPRVGGGGPPCLMAPPRIEIPFPHPGFVWLEGEEETGPCEDVPIAKWTRKHSGTQDLFVYADGPSGSGRYWKITVGIAKAGGAKPERGLCLTASTVGWRTLQKFMFSPLPWLDDVDGDGKAEFILWDSFALRKGTPIAEYGLTAWVYRLESGNSLVLDRDLSRRMARELAASYREPLENASPSLVSLRSDAAADLTQFADDRCSPKEGNSGQSPKP